MTKEEILHVSFVMAYWTLLRGYIVACLLLTRKAVVGGEMELASEVTVCEYWEVGGAGVVGVVV